MGTWDPGQRASNSYLTVEDGKQIQEAVSKMHKNMLFLKTQEANNTLWDNVTCAMGVFVAGVMILVTIYKKIAEMKKFLPSPIRGGQEMTVLPTSSVQMRHY